MSVKQDKVQVSVIVDGKQGISELGKLEMEANDLRHTMQGLKKDSQEYTAAAEQYKQVKAKMGELREEIGLAGLTMKQMRQYARELQTEMDTTATRGTQRYDELKDKLQQVNGAIAAQRSEVAGTSSVWSKISTEVKQFGMLAAGALGFQFVTDQIQNLIAKGSKLSDSLSDIQKTTGMTKAEVREFNSELSKIDTRTSSEELRKIAAGAGQLGIAKKDVLDFTAATDKLVVSLGDEFEGGAEEITKVMGGLRNIFADVKSDKVDVDMLHIGNAINELGAAGSATGPVVADLANRIGGVGITMGLTSGQVLGLSATLQELNVSTERGGTATVKILQAMATEPAKFAKVAGLSVQEFTNLVNTDLYGALVKVTEGAKNSGTQATSLAKVLDTLGVDGAGASEVMAKLGSNTGLLDEKVKLASKSLGSTNSIMSEFATKNDNLAGKLEKLTKQLSGAFTNSVFNDGLEAMVDGLSKLVGTTDEVKELTKAFEEQQSQVQKLSTETEPMLDRYEELRGKTQRSKDEQKEMDDILQQLAKTIPAAVTEWDKYGKAVDLNTQSGKAWVEQQKNMLAVENAKQIEETTEKIDQQKTKIEALTLSINRVPKVKQDNGLETYFVGGAEAVAKMQAQLAKANADLSGWEAHLAKLKGEKTAEQRAAEEAAGAKKGVQQSAMQTIGILEEIDAKIKAFREEQQKVTDANGLKVAAKEIQRIGAEITEQEELKKKLLGESDAKELERARKAREKKAQEDHAAALKNLNDLHAVAMQEQAKLRLVDEDGNQQALNQLDAHYNDLIKRAEKLGHDTRLTEKERRDAIYQIDLLADTRDEAHANLVEEQRKKRAAEDLKFENQHALDRANLRILLAKRNEKKDPEELKNALIAKVELERDIELQNTKLTEDQKRIIIQEAQAKIDAIRSNSAEKQKQEMLKALDQFKQRAGELLDGLMNFAKSLSDNTLKQADAAKNAAVKSAETQQTVAVQAAEKTRDKRLAALEQERIKGTLTTKQYEAKKAQIQADYDADNAASNEQLQKKKADTQAEYDRKAKLVKQEQFEAERAANIAKATIDAAVAAVKALAEGGPIAGPIMAGVIGAMAAINIAAIVATPMPEFKDGGFTANGFTGLQHQNLSRSAGGMLPGGPFMATVNEVGPEYFVPHHLLQQPAVAQSVNIIEAIRTGRTPAFAEGGFSSTPAPAYSTPTSSVSAGGLDQATALRLAVAAEQLTQALNNPAPVRAYLVYQDLTDKEQQLTQLKQANSF